MTTATKLPAMMSYSNKSNYYKPSLIEYKCLTRGVLHSTPIAHFKLSAQQDYGPTQYNPLLKDPPRKGQCNKFLYKKNHPLNCSKKTKITSSYKRTISQ